MCSMMGEVLNVLRHMALTEGAPAHARDYKHGPPDGGRGPPDGGRTAHARDYKHGPPAEGEALLRRRCYR